jgi:hypothetical protein
MFKIFEVMKSTFKTIFSHLFLDFTFSDIFWRCHFDIIDLSTYNSSRGHHEKKTNLKDILVLFNGLWPRILEFQHSGATFLSTLPCLHPIPKIPWEVETKSWDENFYLLFFEQVSYIFHKLCSNTKHVKFCLHKSLWWIFVQIRLQIHFLVFLKSSYVQPHG